MEFSLHVRKGVALVEGVAQFKYLEHTLDQTGDDCQEIRRNIKKDQEFRGWLDKILQRYWEDTQVSKMFYREVVQAVLLFGSDYWVLP